MLVHRGNHKSMTFSCDRFSKRDRQSARRTSHRRYTRLQALATPIRRFCTWITRPVLFTHLASVRGICSEGTMSACGHNGHTDDKTGTDEIVPSGHDSYKEKPASKLVRVLTVLAYLLSVSLAAILLSVYYVCVWKSPELPPISGTKMYARRAQNGIIMEKLQAPGGGDIAVKDNIPISSNNFTTPTDGNIPTTPTTESNHTVNDTEDFQVSTSTYNDTINDTTPFNTTDSIT